MALTVCSLAVFLATAPQQPATIEVIGPAREPSAALREQIAKGQDELLLFDVGCGVRQSVLGLHDVWREVEGTRWRAMRALLDAMQERCACCDDAAAKACADVLPAFLAARCRALSSDSGK